MNYLEEILDNDIFIEMNSINLEIIDLFKKLKYLNHEDFKLLKEKNNQLRKKIRDLSFLTHVPIEPPETTLFLDKLIASSDNIIYGIVPGGIHRIYCSWWI